MDLLKALMPEAGQLHRVTLLFRVCTVIPYASSLLDEGKLVSEITETFGVHVAMIYRLAAAR